MRIHIGKIEESYYYGVYNLLKMIYPGGEFSEVKTGCDIIYEFNIGKDTVCVFRNDIKTEEAVVFENIPLTLKRIIYKLENTVLPFGVLTGIRPSKTVFEHEDTQDALKNIYYVDEKKAELAYKCAMVEKTLAEKIPSKSVSLYVNIPFCPTRCRYCSFTMANAMKDKNILDAYFEVLLKELKYTKDILNKNNISVFSIYIGGGTPTVLDENMLDALTSFLSREFSSAKEFTVEAGRADTINEDKLKILRSNNVTRISINPQTLNENTLELIGRKHTVKQFYDAYNSAVKIGFKNINTDIIAGLNKETFDDFKYTFDNILKLSPQSLTIHTLCKKRSADMDIKDIANENVNVGKMLDYSYSELENIYIPYYMYRQKNSIGSYENVGFVKDSDICMYNVIMMQEIGSVISSGAGGTSKLIDFCDKIPFSKMRTDKQIHTYIQNIDNILEKKKEFIIKNKEKI